jgi:lysyl-tRNA synthetase class I
MAKNTNNRIPVKWVRDKAKAAYEKDSQCYVCGTSDDLELHHLTSITYLLDKWAAETGYDISTDEGILAVRDEFIETHRKEIYDEVYTLCNKHHTMLHGVYGKSPLPSSAPKQERWIQIQKAKVNDPNGNKVPEKSYGSFFSQFI